jgi:4'-phosphopantetheinyl transferase psf-1
MYLLYTNEYKRNSAHSRELLARSIRKLIESDSSIDIATELAALTGEELRRYIADNIEFNKNGKPHIAGIPDYSISHSENTWAIIFSDAPCGLDIQYNKKAKLEKIAVKLYQEDEQESVNKLGIDEFFRIWSRREALIKAAGSSVFYDAPSTMWGSVSYEGYLWRIYDVSLGSEICSADNAETICSDKQCKREGLPHVAVAVRDDSAFGGTNNLQVSTLD